MIAAESRQNLYTLHSDSTVIERLLALRLAEEALESRERRLLLRDQRFALWVETMMRAVVTVACLAIAIDAAPH
jgi:hypothetical protein